MKDLSKGILRKSAVDWKDLESVEFYDAFSLLYLFLVFVGLSVLGLFLSQGLLMPR